MTIPAKYPVMQGWNLLLNDLDIDPSEVLQLAELPKELFSKPNATISKRNYFKLWHVLDLLNQKQELALKYTQVFSIETFDAPLFASICSPNLNIALQRLQKFKPLIGPVVLDLDITPTSTTLSINTLDAEDSIPHSMAMCELVFFTLLARTATRTQIVPLKIYTPTERTCKKAYHEFFGCKIKHGNTIKLVFSAEDANRPFLTENAGMWRFFEPELQNRLSKLSEKDDIRQRVKSALLELLPSGQVSIDMVAKSLAMSKRTLQRKLSADKVTYQNILNETRKELAQYYLTESTTSFMEIAFLLGFQEATSFYRAFSSWTGKTPEQYRIMRY